MTGTNPFRTLLPLLALGLLAGVGGCAASGSTGSSSGSRDVISAEQLAELPSMSALDAVRRLRPRWLRVRGQDNVGTDQGPLVIVDDVPMGSTEMLDAYQIRDLAEIRYLDPNRAMLRYGDRAGAGAVLLVTSGR